MKLEAFMRLAECGLWLQGLKPATFGDSHGGVETPPLQPLCSPCFRKVAERFYEYR